MSSTFAFKKLALIASLAACTSGAFADNSAFSADLYSQLGGSGTLTFSDATMGTGSLTFSPELLGALTVGGVIFAPYQPGIDGPLLVSTEAPLVIDNLTIDLVNGTLYGVTNLGPTTGVTPLWSFTFPGSASGAISTSPGFTLLPGLSNLTLSSQELSLLTSTLNLSLASAVPEPSSLALLGAGLACMGLVSRRRAR